MQGYDAVLITGTDEHGQKVERSPRAAGKTPEEFTTVIADEFRQQWEKLGLKIDRFQRTTDPQHHQVVQELFQPLPGERLHLQGRLHRPVLRLRRAVRERCQARRPCPDCGRPTETVTEENYFFKLSAFTGTLLELYEQNPDFIQPETRRNEVLSFRQAGPDATCPSAAPPSKWGIPVPD